MVTSYEVKITAGEPRQAPYENSAMPALRSKSSKAVPESKNSVKWTFE